jgi:hypothetical protein
MQRPSVRRILSVEKGRDAAQVRATAKGQSVARQRRNLEQVTAQLVDVRARLAALSSVGMEVA